MTDGLPLLKLIKSKYSDSFHQVSEKASSLLKASDEVTSNRSWKVTEEDWEENGEILVSEALFLCHQQSAEGPKIARRARGGHIVTDADGRTVLAKNPLHAKPYFTPAQIHYALKRLEFNGRQIGSAIHVDQVADLLFLSHQAGWVRVHPPFKEGTANRYSLVFS